MAVPREEGGLRLGMYKLKLVVLQHPSRMRVPHADDGAEMSEALLALEWREERIVVHAVRKDHVPSPAPPDYRTQSREKSSECSLCRA